MLLKLLVLGAEIEAKFLRVLNRKNRIVKPFRKAKDKLMKKTRNLAKVNQKKKWTFTNALLLTAFQKQLKRLN